MAFISKCLHHSEILSLSWFVVFLIYFSYLEGSFFPMCVHLLPTQTHTHTHTKIWSDLWFYFSLRKENKNVKRFWISAITMKNIC